MKLVNLWKYLFYGQDNEMRQDTTQKNFLIALMICDVSKQIG